MPVSIAYVCSVEYASDSSGIVLLTEIPLCTHMYLRPAQVMNVFQIFAKACTPAIPAGGLVPQLVQVSHLRIAGWVPGVEQFLSRPVIDHGQPISDWRRVRL